jgi:hypothetical protein
VEPQAVAVVSKPLRRGVLLALTLAGVARLPAAAPPVRADDPATPPAREEVESVPPVPEPSGLVPPAWDRGISEVISPGPLASAHADLEGVSRCNECHSLLGGTPDARCLECHDEIRARMDEGLGFHGGLEGRCAGCHGDHLGRDADLLGLDREGFAHDQALFALRGAHADVPCDDCHVRADPETGRRAFHALGAARDCAGCHESPHADRLARERDCESCHEAAAWDALAPVDAAEGTGFDHGADTRFALDALHAPVPCDGCHESFAEAPPPPRECGDCHRDAVALLNGRFAGREAAPDPHAEAATCRQCHPATVASPTLLDHAASCVGSCHPDVYASLLATQRAVLDEALVAARAGAADAVARRRLRTLARSGLHHPELARALALELARPTR